MGDDEGEATVSPLSPGWGLQQLRAPRPLALQQVKAPSPWNSRGWGLV